MSKNYRCRICYLSIEQREDIESRIVNGDTYSSIQKDYPTISRFVCYRHLKHLNQPEREELVALDRLSKEALTASLETFDYKNLTNELRDRLSCVLLQSMELVEEYTDDVQDQVRSPDDLNSVVTAQRNLLANLDSISGLRKLISLDAAMGLLYAEGYNIVEKTK
jgi:hypothetical protein